jgi:hypothetical protein
MSAEIIDLDAHRPDKNLGLVMRRVYDLLVRQQTSEQVRIR